MCCKSAWPRPPARSSIAPTPCASSGHFRPNGKHKPDAPWQTAEDKRPAVTFSSRSGNDRGGRADQNVAGRALAGLPLRRTGGRRSRRADQDAARPAAAYWMSIPVPGNKFEVKPELRFCHRFVYRTRVNVPAALAGRSFVLRFPSLSLIASVHVNGQFCGWTKAPFAHWECDVTRAVRPGPGQRNLRGRQGFVLRLQREEGGQELPLVLQYARGLDGHAELGQPVLRFSHRLGLRAASRASWRRPASSWPGGVYASDVFVKPSVRKKQLGLEVTLVNSSTQDRTVQIAATR